jgi:site-specific DNA recombinase
MSGNATVGPVIMDIYCRVSTDEQEDNSSLDEQESCGRAYCAEHGYIVGKVWRETYSGFVYRERKDLTKMRERYREGIIQGIVIRTLDRLSRNQTHTAVLMEEMEHHGVTIHCVKEPIDSSPMGKFIIAALALVAEMEREKILDRTMTGRVNKAKDGKVVSGVKALYGWKWVYRQEGDKLVRDHLELDEQQAKVLQEAAREYIEGVSFYQIIERLVAEGVPPPKGEHWHIRTLRRILTDPRMTGQNVKIFTVKNKRAKKHLDPVELPAGTYPRIISDEVYEKVLERANTNSALATRNSRTPERFLLRAGFARCAYCSYVMTTKYATSRMGVEYLSYMCPNPHSNCKHFTVPSERLDAEVWAVVAELADHINLLEESIELAISHSSSADDLQAIELTLVEWKQKVANYEEDLTDTTLRGDTRRGILNLLNQAHSMVERLENDKIGLIMHQVDRDREREEYERILAWCRKVRNEREELTYSQKRDFLRLVGVTVLVERLEKRNAPVLWDIKVRLPKIEEVIYRGRIDELAGGLPFHCELRAAHQ